MKGQPWALLAAVAAAAVLLTVQTLRRQPGEAPPAAESCDAAVTECSAEGGRLTLALGPGIKALTPFPVALRLESLDPAGLTQVTVEFTMPAMEMGRNRYRLDLADDGAWRGQATLPICTSGNMEWLATVEARAGEKVVARAEFPFVMEK